jgi:hypothetical protein
MGIPLLLDPGRRAGFDRLDQVRLADSTAQTNCKVDMVDDTANPISFALVVTTYGGKVGVHAWGYGSIKPLLAVFSAENDMDNDLAEGLGHRRNSNFET